MKKIFLDALNDIGSYSAKIHKPHWNKTRTGVYSILILYLMSIYYEIKARKKFIIIKLICIWIMNIKMAKKMSHSQEYYDLLATKVNNKCAKKPVEALKKKN